MPETAVHIIYDPHVAIALSALGFALAILILLLLWNVLAPSGTKR